MRPLAKLICLILCSGFGFSQTSVVYTVDSTRSTVAISGTLLGLPLMEQDADSLRTTFSGAIDATLNSGTGNVTQVQFPANAIVAAEDSGSWAPRATGASGTEPANYGFMVAGPIPAGIPIPPIPGVTVTGFEAVTAIRDLEITVGSPALPVDPAGFLPGTQLVATVLMGDIAVSVDFLATTLFGTVPFTVTNFTFTLTDAVATNTHPLSSISQSNGIETLTIELDTLFPIDFDSLVPFAAATTNASVFELQGTLVATRTLPVAPTNRPPVLRPVPNQFVTAGTVLDIAVTAQDRDPGQTLSYTASGPGASMSSNVVTVTTTPADAYTVSTILVTVTDDGSPPRSDTETFEVHIAGEPVITNITPSAARHDITFQSMAGFTYELEMATMLGLNDNFTLLGGTTATNGFGVLSVSAPFAVQQFFRIRIRP